ncbi:leukocyte receptor cluster member 8 homolog isoform X2 [Nasonia vitripennis]|uniref:PCI domain-containing protein n=1 Tax=Nasonia vitripennis TaxID=7425 RepID=A0A7M7G7S6_NASVI|nr:leukocyte receptor cluster member 8 homolog isoform X2 [Nasonia vitripennis]
MSDGSSEALAATQKQQQQQFQQQQQASMANMAWQYGQNNMHLYSHYAGQMYGQNYAQQSQMYYQHYGMMGGYPYNHNQLSSQSPQQQQQMVQQQLQTQTQQNQSQGQQQQQQQTQQSQQNSSSGKQQAEQPPIPPTPMTFDDDSDLPPLPPGPPPPPTPVQNQLHKSQQSPLTQQQSPLAQQMPIVQQFDYAHGAFPYGNWNSISQSESSHFSGIRFNLPNKKTGLGFNNTPPSGNSGAAKKKRKRNKQNLAAQYNNFQTPPPSINMSIPPPNMYGANTPNNKQQQHELPPLPPPMQVEKPPTPPPIDEINIPPEQPPLPKMPPINTSQPPPPLPPSRIAAPAAQPATPSLSTPSGGGSKSSPKSSAAPSPVGDWPDSLKDYVNRCYEKCKTAVDKDQVEIILKGKITRSANDGSLWVKDWDREPLPSIHSERMTMTVKPLTITVSPGGLRKSGLSMTLGARLGARSANSPLNQNNSNASPGGNQSNASMAHRRPSKSKSRSRSRSHSPAPRKYRRSTSSSSSSERDYKIPMTSVPPPSAQKNKKAGRGGANVNQNNAKQNKKNKNKNKLNNKANCHFYSEFGLAGGNVEEFGTKEKLQQRAARFSDMFSKGPQVSSLIKDDPTAEFDFTGLHIVGTCRDLEKPYLRLTSAPAASAVRPVSVLRKSLDHVKKRWATQQDYRYACDQLKSIRQDLTVQGIRDSFTVHVYETHARVALERGDHEEFNQCQTQLRMLYTEIGGDNRCEFVAYRILYYIFTKNTLDLTTILAALSEKDKKDECIDHALKVRSAWWLGNFHCFFKLYKKAPRMAAFLMDWFIARERKLALKQMIKVYRQNLAVDFIVAELAFESSEKFYEFVAEFGLVYTDPGRKQLDCKTSSASVGAW